MHVASSDAASNRRALRVEKARLLFLTWLPTQQRGSADGRYTKPRFVPSLEEVYGECHPNPKEWNAAPMNIRDDCQSEDDLIRLDIYHLAHGHLHVPKNYLGVSAIRGKEQQQPLYEVAAKVRRQGAMSKGLGDEIRLEYQNFTTKRDKACVLCEKTKKVVEGPAAEKSIVAQSIAKYNECASRLKTLGASAEVDGDDARCWPVLKENLYRIREEWKRAQISLNDDQNSDIQLGDLLRNRLEKVETVWYHVTRRLFKVSDANNRQLAESLCEVVGRILQEVVDKQACGEVGELVFFACAVLHDEHPRLEELERRLLVNWKGTKRLLALEVEEAQYDLDYCIWSEWDSELLKRFEEWSTGGESGNAAGGSVASTSSADKWRGLEGRHSYEDRPSPCAIA